MPEPEYNDFVCLLDPENGFKTFKTKKCGEGLGLMLSALHYAAFVSEPMSAVPEVHKQSQTQALSWPNVA